MKFFISKTKKLKNKFGDWYFWHDEKVKIKHNVDSLILYHGYTINDLIENYLDNLDHLQEQDGNFFAVKITQNKLEAITDTFCQNKIFYRPNEITNSVELFPFKAKDINTKILLERFAHPTIDKWPVDFGPNSYMDYAGRSQDRMYSAESCITVFKNTFLLQPNHKLVYDNKFSIIRNYDLKHEVQTSLRGDRINNVEDKIFQRMQTHANVINKNYNNVYSSVSEGIDSALQDCFFPNAISVYYDYFPNNVPEEYKRLVQQQSNNKSFKHDTMNLNDLKNIVTESMNDPTCCYLDTIPSQWQMKKYNDADILLFGQCGDQIFMHLPWVYHELTFCNIRKKYHTPAEVEQKFNEALEQDKNCYAVKDDIRHDVKLTYQEVYGTSIGNSMHKTYNNYSEDSAIPSMSQPGLYNRDIAHAINIPVTSLYSDKELYFLIYKLPFDQMLDNAKNITVQKNILQKRFNKQFHTPYKDAASFLTIPIIKTFYKHTVDHCLKNHFSSKLK